jgi:putative transposase
MIAFIDDHRAAYGVEPICKVLPIAPCRPADRGQQAFGPCAAGRRTEGRGSAGFAENFGVYGARKVWRQLRREGFAGQIQVIVATLHEELR